MKIEWKDIPGYQGLYQVSNNGEVKSLKKEVKTKSNSLRTVSERILKTAVNQHGYVVINLYKEGVSKNWRVHRLVALVFCSNPNDLNVVNHIDGNKLNNHYSNLEWCTHSDNVKHAYSLGLMSATRNRLGFKGKLHKDSKPVIQSTLCNKFVKEHESINMTKEDGYTPQNVHKCCIGKLKTHQGYKWAFKTP
jgi:hypothetical protein